MIGRVHKRGKKLSGLIWYLYGPGDHEEHVNPRVVAAWDQSVVSCLEPVVGAGGRRDFRGLIEALEQPVAACLRPPDAYVWHCSLRNDASDRVLSDTQWADIARQAMHDAGLASRGDDEAVRWVAVRHGDDHIHIAATLVRQDGRVEKAWNDYLRLRKSCMGLEQEYGLVSTAPADRTALRRANRAERGRVERASRPETYLEYLQWQARQAYAASTSTQEYFARLADAGLLVRFRYSKAHPDVRVGYAVGLPGYKSAAGQTVWYAGGKLAPELTLPKLQVRWQEQLPVEYRFLQQSRLDSRASTNTSATTSASKQQGSGWHVYAEQSDGGQKPSEDVRLQAQDSHPIRRPGVRVSAQQRAHIYTQAAHELGVACEQMQALIAPRPDAAAAIAQAAADSLVTMSVALEGRYGGPLSRAARSFDRAARQAYGVVAQPTDQARRLSQRAYDLAQAGRVTSGVDKSAAGKVVGALVDVAEMLARLRSTYHRLHQAQAAVVAAQHMRAVIHHLGVQTTGSNTAGVTPTVAVLPTQDHGYSAGL